MSKANGLGSTMLVHGTELGDDIGSVSRIGSPVGVQDLTGLTKSARETGLLLRDGMIDYAPFFNPASGQIHAVLSALPRTDVITSYLHRRDEQGTPAACLVGKQVNYDGTRSASGELTFATANTGNGSGLEWCRCITAGVETSTGAENLDSYDGGAETDYGMQAYLQVVAFTGTSATITIEESSDDGSGDSWAAVTGGAFTAVTDTGAQRIATANDQTIERYLRVAITGTYSNLELAVMVNRNPIADVEF